MRGVPGLHTPLSSASMQERSGQAHLESVTPAESVVAALDLEHVNGLLHQAVRNTRQAQASAVTATAALPQNGPCFLPHLEANLLDGAHQRRHLLLVCGTVGVAESR